MMISYAQNREDVLLARCFPGITDGFYIDVGAALPETDSVTKHFYERGWSGINLEPVVRFFDMLAEARTRDINLNMAAGDKSGEITFYEIADTGLSTIVEAVAEHHTEDGRAVLERTVPVRTLDDILAENPPPHGDIHFLKIDVEGAEESVLRGLSLSIHRPWVILLEATEPNTNAFSYAWEHLLLEKAYQFAFFDGINRYYVSPDHPELMVHFNRPVNFLDDYESRDLNHFRRTLELRDNELLAAHQTLKTTSDRLEQLANEHAAQKTRADALSRQLSDVLGSTSWKVTAPLRVVQRLIRFGASLPRRAVSYSARLLANKVIALSNRSTVVRKLAARFPIFKKLWAIIKRYSLAPDAGDDEYNISLSELPEETTNIYNLIKRNPHEDSD